MSMPVIIFLDPADEADVPLVSWLQWTYKWGIDKGIIKIMVGHHPKGMTPRGFDGAIPERVENFTTDRSVCVYHRPGAIGAGYVVHVSAELPADPLAGGVDFLPRVGV